MTDTVSSSVRSRIMASVKQRHTKPELLVRSRLHQLGYRFRVQRRDLPGSPDIVLPKYRTAIFVHGCFWHQHKGCSKSRKPTSNNDYWDQKLLENVRRDRRKVAALKKLDWRVILVWECETKDTEKLKKKLEKIAHLY
ncbi:MAG: DNA mismatch endonuclease Vsr [Acidobacteriota bacterium]